MNSTDSLNQNNKTAPIKKGLSKKAKIWIIVIAIAAIILGYLTYATVKMLSCRMSDAVYCESVFPFPEYIVENCCGGLPM